jgi:peptide/nickel transport system substrate-binding protein
MSPGGTRRRFLWSGLPAVAAANSACARISSPAPEFLRVGAGPDRYNLSPGRFTFGISRPNVHLAEPPVRPDTSFQPGPCLFESWNHEGEGSYVARLRKGVEFHDGTQLNAEIFIRSAVHFIATRDFIGLDPNSLRRIDEHTVRFHSAVQSAWMVDNMTHPSASLFLPSEATAAHPIGTGPYRFVRYEPQRCIEVERFERYWGPAPAQARIQFRFLADPQARLLALRAGEVDLISEVVPEMLLGISPDEPGLALLCSRPIRYAALLCNLHGNPPYHVLRDIRIRRALALAIDRDAIARTLYLGRGQVARGVLPGWMFGLGEAQPAGFGFDRIQAQDLLEQAGWRQGADGVRIRGGVRLQLRLVAAFPNASSVRPIPEMLGQMFRTVGVDLEIIEVDDDQLYYSGYADSGQADLFLELAANANSDPTFLLFNVFHTRTPWRSYRYSAPGGDVDSLLDAARHSADRRAAIDAVREAHRRIIDNHVAAIPILLVPAMIVARTGLTIHPFENVDWINFGTARRHT